MTKAPALSAESRIENLWRFLPPAASCFTSQAVEALCQSAKLLHRTMDRGTDWLWSCSWFRRHSSCACPWDRRCLLVGPP